MKKILILILCILFNNTVSNAQAKKPTIMVIPSDFWYSENGYMMEFDDQGTIVKIPDYKKGFQENGELIKVIAMLSGLMNERGFPLVDMEANLKKIEGSNARNMMMSSNSSGSSLAESPYDKLIKTANADIIIQLTWRVKQSGPKKSVDFTINGIDAYTSKPVAVATGIGAPSFSADATVLLEEAVLTHIDNFNSQLQMHFDDLLTNGREGALVVQVWEDAGFNLETEYNLKGRTAELNRIINSYWMPRNTVSGRFNQEESTENIQNFSQVRIPLYGDDGWGGEIAMDFTTWGNQLSDFLKSEFGITAKVMTRGLGQVNLVLGSK